VADRPPALPCQLGGLRPRLGAEFCRAAEANPRVCAYVKNQPYLLGATPKKYLPDFIVRVDDGHGDDDLLNLVVEIKGYRDEDAKDKANTMDAYWVPGVNNLGTFGRWAFAEFKESVYAIAANFDALIERAVYASRRRVAHTSSASG